MDDAIAADVTVRYVDTDALGHVNHAVYVSYLEVARGVYYDQVVERFPAEVTTVVVNLEIDYRREIEFGATVVVKTRVTELTDRSFRMDYEVRADGELAATATTVQAVVDPEVEESKPIPDEWRRRIRDHEGW